MGGLNSLTYLYFTFQLAIFAVYFIASYKFFPYFFYLLSRISRSSFAYFMLRMKYVFEM